jgi:endonuclease YncB( thermonuclease family)
MDAGRRYGLMTRRDAVFATMAFGVSTLAFTAAVPTSHASSSTAVLETPPMSLTNPFLVQFDTVGMVPKSYFEENRYIYAYTERILDGDTVRVRHIPGYGVWSRKVQPLQKRGIADETLSIRLYGVDAPEVAKNKNQKTQPYAEEAKEFLSDKIYHRMVRITFLRKDRYGRAVAAVETLPRGGFLLGWIPGLRSQDMSVELAKEGLAELYANGGAEYWVR